MSSLKSLKSSVDQVELSQKLDDIKKKKVVWRQSEDVMMPLYDVGRLTISLR